MRRRASILLFISVLLVSAVLLMNCGGDAADVTITGEQLAKFLSPEAQADDNFGSSVAISGDYIVVGAWYEDGGPGDTLSDAGAAYIFHRTGNNTWDAGTRIVASDAQADDHFGRSVSISGDYVIVGAYLEDGGPGDSLTNAGAAYIFHRTGTNTWDAGIKIVSDDAQAYDWFGWSVSISGDYAIVGARDEDGGSGDPFSSAGAAYIFHRTGLTSWIMDAKLIAADQQAGDSFGSSASINDEYAIVGAYFEDGGPGDPHHDAGAAYIFHRTGTNSWDTGVKIVASDVQAIDRYGNSVSISGDYAIVGAYLEDGDPGDPIYAAGAAYIFHRTGTNAWNTGTKIVAPDAQEGDVFGYSVSISGAYAIVGANSEDGGPGDPLSDAGAAYIFQRTGTNAWNTGTRFAASDAQEGDNFGFSVASSGGYAIVGASSEDGGEGDPISDAGAAYLYD